MKIQLVEKEKAMQSLQRSVSNMEQRQAADQNENEAARALREETEELHAALRLASPGPMEIAMPTATNLSQMKILISYLDAIKS